MEGWDVSRDLRSSTFDTLPLQCLSPDSLQVSVPSTVAWVVLVHSLL